MTTTDRQQRAEQAVLDYIRECNGLVSSFWDSSNGMILLSARWCIEGGNTSIPICGMRGFAALPYSKNKPCFSHSWLQVGAESEVVAVMELDECSAKNRHH